MQYIQYPYPAGLKMLSRDKFWRAQYDKVPQPPPHHFPGADKITIHEDTDGDGVYDSHKTFLEGLSIVTSCALGRGGVWVLNPPYLLFYPDADHDDVPDGDPVVHLSGFGMEDTHSVTNSIRFGPDGWLYASQGSTVSGNVIRPGLDKKPVHSMGQLIWRYHPETKRYEIFAEGGGNAFGVEIDAKGRIFSGHNGGNTRGFHYVQGGYLQKGFSKHGPLSNPFSFGYFPPMEHGKVPRFTHTFVIYEGAALPPAYHGKLFGVAPLLYYVNHSQLSPDGSTYRTRDLGYFTSSDKRYRPVDIKAGPDGALYIADLHEIQASHREHFAGKIEKETGRVYRIQAKGAAPTKPFNLAAKSTDELIDTLRHPNKWYRQTALRLLGDRKDLSAVPRLEKLLTESRGQLALEVLWALNLYGGFDDPTALQALGHPDPFVRLWTARLLGDDRRVSPRVAARLAALAATEPHLEVRSQLACTARRLPAAHGLPVVRALLGHDADADDNRIPLLLWWAIEANCKDDHSAVFELFEQPAIWDQPLVHQHVIHRLMQRFAMTGARKDLLLCARLLQLSPTKESTAQLMRGFEEAFKGRALANLPPELVKQLTRAGGGSLALRVRQGEQSAVAEALRLVTTKQLDATRRLELVQIFGEVDLPGSVPVLLELVASSDQDAARMAALTALQRYNDPLIGQAIVQQYGEFPPDVRDVAQTLLASRGAWARQLLEAVDAGRIDKATLPDDVVRKLTVHRDPAIAPLVKKHWGALQGATTEQMSARIQHLLAAVDAGTGDPYAGKKLFTATCAKCHVLFGAGGRIGPDLTAYKRDDTRNMLLNVVNPSAEIREGFETLLVVTSDGRAVSGFLVDQDNQVLVLRGIDGQNIVIQQDDVEDSIKQPKSIMPEGLLSKLDDQQVRDLFAFLRSGQPLND